MHKRTGKRCTLFCWHETKKNILFDRVRDALSPPVAPVVSLTDLRVFFSFFCATGSRCADYQRGESITLLPPSVPHKLPGLGAIGEKAAQLKGVSFSSTRTCARVGRNAICIVVGLFHIPKHARLDPFHPSLSKIKYHHPFFLCQ